MVREWLPELWFEKPFLYSVKPIKPGLPVPKCANFEKDYYKCAEGVGYKRAQKECRLQIEDLMECSSGAKTILKKMRPDFEKYPAGPEPDNCSLSGRIVRLDRISGASLEGYAIMGYSVHSGDRQNEVQSFNY
ncbi:putative NADH dehydrogenase [Apostichopus japonicus]|uniref:Putative NADH dehydrogenase n=1 Tax=Stichopus japonicus TaxID=307972 RepID=A0A2G8JNG3_STIJA|nr:putative NADH dehydrogenase [Apostichopus japonicus]